MDKRYPAFPALFLPLLLAAALAPAPAAAQTAWPMYQANAAHTGYLPIDVDPASFSLRWQKSLSTTLALNPVATADGRVFVSLAVWFDAGASFFALDAADGAELWSKDFGNASPVNPPSVRDGKLYIQTGPASGSQGLLRAYEVATGAPVFQVPYWTQGDIHLAPTLFAGSVYVNGSSDGSIYAFDGASGAQQWVAALPFGDRWTPAVDDRYAYSYLEGELHAIDRMSGREAFRIDGPQGAFRFAPAPVLGALGNALVIDAGQLISFDLSGRRIGYAVKSAFTGQPALAHGVVYCIDGGALSARDEASGGLLWSWAAPAGGSLTGNLVVTHGHVFARTASTTYAIDLATRTSVWSFPAAGHLALGNETLYIAGARGSLTAIGLSATPVPQPPALNGLGPRMVIEGDELSFTIHAEDPNGDALVFGAVAPLPEGASFNEATQVFSWTPTHDQIGTHMVTFGVSDGTLNDEGTTAIRVVPIGDSLVWEMYQGNAAHTGYVPVTLDPTAFLHRWKRKLSDFQFEEVAAAAGKVFASHFDSVAGPSLSALDAANGSTLWTQVFGQRQMSVSPPSCAAGAVFVQASDYVSGGSLRAYAADTGALLSQASVRASADEGYRAPTLHDGRAFVNGGSLGGMYGLDGTSGAQLWFNDNLPHVERWTPAVDDRYAWVLLGENHPTLFAIDRLSGRTAFTIVAPDVPTSGHSGICTPVIAGDGSIVGILRGRLYRFDVANRRIRYAISGDFHGQPAVAGGVVYAMQAGVLAALDLATGQRLWTWQAPAGVPLHERFLVTRSHLFASTDAATYAVDLSTHAAVWSYPRGGRLALGNRDLYIADDNGYLTAIALSPTAVQEPPSLAAIGAKSVVEGKRLVFALSAMDANGDAVTYESLDPLPARAALAPETGVFSWTPGFDQAGVYRLRFRALDGGAPPLYSEPVSVTVTVRNRGGRVFFDDFADGAAEQDWMQAWGNWSAAGGVYRATSTAAANLSRIALFEPTALPLGAGVIQAKIRLKAGAGDTVPNGMILFGYQDDASYRWLKVSTTGVVIGQTGVVGGVAGGVKKRVSRPLATGAFALVTLKIYPDGWVRAFVDSATPVLAYRFLTSGVPSVARGGVGIGTLRAVTAFDDVAVWEDSALGP